MRTLLTIVLLVGSALAQGGMMPGPGTVHAAGGGGSDTPVVTDTWSGMSNGQALTGRNAWVACGGGDPGFVFDGPSGTVIPSNEGADACNINTDAGISTTNQYFKTVITNRGGDTTAGNGTGPGGVLRWSTSVKTGYRIVVNAATTNNIELSWFGAGTYHLIWQRTCTTSNGDTLEGRVVGSTIQVFVNSTQCGANTTDANVASGQPGLGYSSTSSGLGIGTTIVGNASGLL